MSRIQSQLVSSVETISCCYCGQDSLEYRRNMVLLQRRKGKDPIKTVLKWKNLDIWYCGICKRHCVSFKKKTKSI